MPQSLLARFDHHLRPAGERSVFLSQLLLTAALFLLVVINVVMRPMILRDPWFFFGALIVFTATAVAAMVPWRRVNKSWTMLLPVVDIIALGIAREGQPLSGVSFLLVFPVIWLSTHFGTFGAATGVALAGLVVWVPALLAPGSVDLNDVSRLAALPIMLSFVAVITSTSTRQTRAQQVLLTQQAAMFETALRRSRREWQTLEEIFDAVDFGVIGFDRSHRVTFINRAQRELLARYGVIDGRPTTDRVYIDDQHTLFGEAERPFNRAMRGETVDGLTVWLGDEGQKQTALLVSARPIVDEANTFDGGVMVVREVTAELRAVRARDDLLASVSHELRTPLTSIVGYLELVLDSGRIDEGNEQMLGIASKNADRMLVLVAELLTAASDATHALALAPEICELSGIVTDSVDSLLPLAEQGRITLEVGELPRLPLHADPFRLRQVIDNVLSNAVKYNVRGGGVVVFIRVTPAAVEVRVTDTGRGMTLHEQEHLFDRFYRADSVRGTSVHGYGLGLSISRDIMRQHGGDLRLESVPGRGTTAIVSLPLTPFLSLTES
ncbi:MAG: HAMP domain-containing sensor histidine kinase [Cryobacterium sp.]